MKETKTLWKIIATAHEQQFHIIIKVQKAFDGFDMFFKTMRVCLEIRLWIK